MIGKRFTAIIAFSFLFSYIFADPTPGNKDAAPIERLINEVIYSYPIEDVNLTRLATYTELKGIYTRETGHLQVHFGSYGTLQFYQGSCLLKTYDGYYSLTPEEKDPDKLASFNRALFNLLESIPLLNNQQASPNHVAFVDHFLSRKSLAAFDKIYVRHILIKYGRFDQDQVTFQDDWLPEHVFVEFDENQKLSKKQGQERLKLVLSARDLRGWYMDIDAQVYAKDVEREVFYASGELMSKNIGALNLFVQKLYLQTAQLINKHKHEIAVMKEKQLPVFAFQPEMEEVSPKDHPALQHTTLKEIQLKNHPYQRNSWIPTMLSLLRHQNISFHDPDIANILLNHPSFDAMLGFMTTDEQEGLFALIQ